MRLIIITLLLGNYVNVAAQNYYTGYELFDLFDKCSNKEELFENRDQPFQINQYHVDIESDSLDFVGGCSFHFLNNEVIQTCEFKNHRRFCNKRFWKWQPNLKGDKFGFILECNKKGIALNISNSFYTTKTSTTDTDSIVDQIKWTVDKHGDTSCRFMHRWIYRNDTVAEYWQQYIENNECSWSTQPTIRIQKYFYPSSNTTIRESYIGSFNRKQLYGVFLEVKTFDSIGRLVSFRVFPEDTKNDNEGTEYRYFYEKQQWVRIEQWYNKELIEVIKLEPLPSTKSNVRKL